MTEAALVIDGSIVEGGATSVVIEAAKALDGDVFVGFSDNPEWWERKAPNDAEVLGGVPSVIPRDVVAAKRIHELHIPEYDTVITSGPPAKLYHPSDGQRWIHFGHHPSVPYQLQNTGSLVKYPLALIDKVETRAIPELIVNSELTSARMRLYYAKQSDAIISPPVRVDELCVTEGDGSFVMVGRISERKRTAIAVDAFRDAPYELHVVGDGPLRGELEARATDNVTFHGYLPREKLVDRIERSSFGVFLSRSEDFGITPIELLAAGLPVVAVDEPNTNNQIEDGLSGTLVEPVASDVRTAAAETTRAEWDRDAIRRTALDYSVERFHERMREFVRNGEDFDARTAGGPDEEATTRP